MARYAGYTPYQQGILRRYFENFDTLHVQKLSEIVSDLYLADSPKKADKLWKQAEKSLVKICEDKAWMDKILADRNVEQLAKLVGELNGKK